MAKLCFGGDSNDLDSPDRKPTGRSQKRWWNAYILFYERVDQDTPTIPLDIDQIILQVLLRKVIITR